MWCCAILSEGVMRIIITAAELQVVCRADWLFVVGSGLRWNDEVGAQGAAE